MLKNYLPNIPFSMGGISTIFLIEKSFLVNSPHQSPKVVQKKADKNLFLMKSLTRITTKKELLTTKR